MPAKAPTCPLLIQKQCALLASLAQGGETREEGFTRTGEPIHQSNGSRRLGAIKDYNCVNI